MTEHENKPWPMKELTRPHVCAQCNVYCESEKLMIHLSIDGLIYGELELLPGKFLGEWIHKECYIPFFKEHETLPKP